MSTKRIDAEPVDPMLAPFEHLWLPARAIIDFIHQRYSEAEVLAQLDVHAGSYRRYCDAKKGKQSWIRFDAADRLLVALGIVASELPVEPTYCSCPRNLKEIAA